MKKLSLAAIALSAAATSLVTTPAATASGTTTGPDGRKCGYAATTDPNPEADANDMTGEINAGPATTTAGAGGTMYCTIQVNSNTHDGPDAAVREFASDANGVIAGVQTVSYSTAEDAQDYLCTSFRRASDGMMMYWTVDATTGAGHWHTTPNVPCGAAIQTGTDRVWAIVDPIVCEQLAARSNTEDPGPQHTVYIDDEGDVFIDLNQNGIHEAEAEDELFYDCPTYASTINDPDENPDKNEDGETIDN